MVKSHEIARKAAMEIGNVLEGAKRGSKLGIFSVAVVR
jgi:hypothetical protein